MRLFATKSATSLTNLSAVFCSRYCPGASLQTLLPSLGFFGVLLYKLFKLIAYYVKEAYKKLVDDNSETYHSYFAVAILLASVMRMTDPLPDTTIDRILESDDLTDDDRISVCAGFISKAIYENDERLLDDYLKKLFDLLEDLEELKGIFEPQNLFKNISDNSPETEN